MKRPAFAPGQRVTLEKYANMTTGERIHRVTMREGGA